MLIYDRVIVDQGDSSRQRDSPVRDIGYEPATYTEPSNLIKKKSGIEDGFDVDKA